VRHPPPESSWPRAHPPLAWPTVRYRLVPLSVPAVEALVRGDIDTASDLCGEQLSPWLLEAEGLWRLRLRQLQDTPEDLPWIARPAIALEGADAGAVVGIIGFHAAPDEDGRVEVGYRIDPAYQRRGHARALLALVIETLEASNVAHVLRASISPGNEASLATIRGFGFEEVGEQWDEEDGLELLYERQV
jgi:[ribosomal protein S5]-alanine N-acetyltransferase